MNDRVADEVHWVAVEVDVSIGIAEEGAEALFVVRAALDGDPYRVREELGGDGDDAEPSVGVCMENKDEAGRAGRHQRGRTEEADEDGRSEPDRRSPYLPGPARQSGDDPSEDQHDQDVGGVRLRAR